jgi:hypothetical protein
MIIMIPHASIVSSLGEWVMASDVSLGKVSNARAAMEEWKKTRNRLDYFAITKPTTT